MPTNTKIYQRSPMPVNYVRNLVELMVDYGLDKDQLLAKAGLTHEQVFSPREQLRFEQFRRVMLAGHELSGDDALGLKFGQKLMLTAHGLLGYAVMSSANLEEAMVLLQRYFCTRTRLCAPTFERHERGGLLQFHEMMELGSIRQIYLEVVVAAVVSTMRFVVGDAVSYCRLQMPFVRPSYGDQYTKLLGLPVSFEHSVLAIDIPQKLLIKSFPMADETSRLEAAKKCEEELMRLEADQDMEAKVRQHLMKAEADIPGVETLAEYFHMTSRTLRRRLEAANTTYQAILDDVRRLRALRYLDSRLPVQQVAWLLGYADPSNFSRAFRKWTGMSPTAYIERS